MENYSWLSVGNQGYNKYPKGTVGPGSKEVLDKAANFHAGVDHTKPMTLEGQGIKKTVKIEIVDKPTFQPNRWGDFGTDYNLRPGDGRMQYGEEELTYMNDRWKKYYEKKGKTKAMDGAGSKRAANGEIILSSTYREVKPDGTIGDYLGKKLNVQGAKYIGVKDADIGIMIPTKEMKEIVTSEGQRIKIKPGTYIAADALGLYAPKTSDILKKNKPTTPLAKEVATKIGKFEKIKTTATQYVKDGFISGQEGKRLTEKAWALLQEFSAKIPKR